MWLYRWLIRLSPRALRREYGTAMEDMFSRRLADARVIGMSRTALVWWRELTGLLVLAASERWGATTRLRRRQQQMHASVKAGVMDTMWQEILHAARRLVRTPMFTTTAVVTLALAIGANVAIFTVVYRVVMNPLPVPDSSRLIALDYGLPRQNIPSGITSMSWQLYHYLSENARSLAGVAAYTGGPATLTGSATPERIVVTRATPTLSSVLRVSPALGRWFTDAEGTPGAPAVAVLSHGLWVRRFGADPDVVGRALDLDGVSTEIVGVMPAAFSFPDSRTDMWIAAQSSRANASFLFTLTGVARLRDGVTLESANTEITALIEAVSRVAPNQRGLVSSALPLQDAIVGRIARALWILLASVGLVLLVACANIANLFLVRGDTRQREVAVRRALGAGNRGIARYFLTESTLLAVTGAALGLLIAWGGVRMLVAFGPATLPRLDEVRIDGVVLIFAAGLWVFAAALFGAIPLFRLAPLATSLHENGRGQTATRGTHRARQLLMGGQVALALILLIASGLMVRSFQKLRAVDPGFNSLSALTFNLGLPSRKYTTRESAVAAHRAILERLSAIPGVVGGSTSTCLPLSGGCFGNGLVVEGEAFDPRRNRPFVWFRGISGEYLDQMNIPVVRGRKLDRRDIDRADQSVVVNQAFSDGYFPGQDPLGRRIRSSFPPNSKLPTPPWLTIVGVVANTSTQALNEPTPAPQMFMPMSIAGGPDIPREALIGPDVTMMNYVVRSALPPAELMAPVRNAIAQVDPNLAIAQVRTLQDIVDRASDQTSFTMVLLAIAASVASLLGAIGIYGVISYIVTQRTGEIGVRLAMGAAPRSVARMILQQGTAVTLLGLAVGLIASVAGGRLIRSLLYGVTPHDPVVFAATTLGLLMIALLACWLPARRAAKMSPLQALRTD